MDCDSVYIKMCEKAEEIQQLWKPAGGDWYIFDYHNTTRTSRDFKKQLWGDKDETWRRIEILCYRPSELKDWWISTGGGSSLVKSAADMVREHSIWLPRQDQLQILSGLTWQEFDKECLKYDAETKEQAGIQVVMDILTRLSDNVIM